jgi:hypothetical protein
MFSFKLIFCPSKLKLKEISNEWIIGPSY